MSDAGEGHPAGAAFLAALAHAIRSPLGVADGALAELSDAPPGDAPMLLDMARRNVARLLELAKRLDQLAEVEAGALESERAPCDPMALLRELVERHSDGRVALQLEGGGCGSVLADRALLERALSLVMDNALRFARSRVLLRVVDGRDASGSADKRGRRCVIQIDDDGPGLGDVRVAALFERYGDGRARGCAREFATGLSLAREYMRAMGGDLWLESLTGPAGDAAIGTRCTLEVDTGASEHARRVSGP